jgi:hypothetical protein
MMARNANVPFKGRIQKRKDLSPPNHHFRLATRGRSIQSDAIHVGWRASELVDSVNTVGNQAAGGDVVAVIVDRRQLVARGQRNDQIAMKNRQRARGHDQPAVWAAREGCNRALTSIAAEGDTD